MGQFACHACDKTVVFWARAGVERGANLQVTQYRRAILQRKNSQVQTIGGLLSALLAVQAGATRQVHIDLGMRIAGTFHQPALAVCDTAFLDSLPHAELRSGAGELVKYAMIGPGELYRTVTRSLSRALAGDRAALTACVKP